MLEKLTTHHTLQCSMLYCNDWSDLRHVVLTMCQQCGQALKQWHLGFQIVLLASPSSSAYHLEPSVQHNSTWLSIQFDLCHILYFILCLSLGKYWTDSLCFSHLPIDHVSLYSEIVSFIVFFQSNFSFFYYLNLFCYSWHGACASQIISRLANWTSSSSSFKCFFHIIIGA